MAGNDTTELPAGMLESGNIDLKNRPRVENDDGSVSTVRSIGVNVDGKELLLPTVSDDGRILSNQDAIAQYKTTGRHLGVFTSPEASTRYAQQLHEDQAAALGDDPFAGVPVRGMTDGAEPQDSESGDAFQGVPFPKSKLEDIYSQVSLEDPDRAAKILRLASHLDSTPEEIAANLPAATASASAPSKSLLDDISKNYPKTRDFVSSPRNMAVARDDLGNLRNHEELVHQVVKSHTLLDELIAGYQSGVTDQLMRHGILGKGAKELSEKMDLREMPGADQGFWHQQAAAAGALASDFPAMVAGSFAGGVAGGGAGGAAGSVTVPGVGTVGLGAVGTVVGAGMGAFALPTAIKSTLREYGKGNVKDSADFWARTKTVMAETMKSAVIGGITSPAGAIAGKFVGPAVSRLGLQGAGGRVAAKALDAGARIGTESATMEVGSATMEGRKPTLEGALSNIILMTGVHGAHALTGHVGDLLNLQKTVDAQAFYKALGSSAEASKLRERLPDEYQKHIAKLTENGPVEHVFIPHERFQAYFQEKGLDPKAVAAELGAADSFAEAEKTGAPVQIPLAQWATKVAPTEHFQALAPDIKFDADSMTPRELEAHAEERQASIKQQMSELDAKVKEQENPATADEGASKVQADVEAQLTNTKVGMGAAEAKANAQLWGARFRVLGEQTGRDPWDLYQEHRLTVARREGPEAVNEKMFEQGADGPAAPPFYSKLTRTIEEKMGNSATADQVRGMVKEIKPEERKWLGLDDFLNGKEKVTKQELLDHLRANALEVKEVTRRGEAPDVDASIRTYGDEGEVYFLVRDSNDEVVSNEGPFKTQEEAEEAAQRKYKEIFLGGGGESAGPTKFEQYTLPGGENYRELLFQLPDKTGKAEAQEEETKGLVAKSEEYDRLLKTSSEKGSAFGRALRAKLSGRASEVYSATQWASDVRSTGQRNEAQQARFDEIRSSLTPSLQTLMDEYAAAHIEFTTKSQELFRARMRLTENVERQRKDPNQYKSSHWDESNVLAHVRLNDRTDAEGKKVLFVEEIQSDWHQAGRKNGYRGEGDAAALEAANKRLREVNSELEPLNNKKAGATNALIQQGEDWMQANKMAIERGLWSAEEESRREALLREKDELVSQTSREEHGRVPDAPFRKTWHEFALKRILRMAAEGGYDRVAWTTGEQQAARYDLSKQVSEIRYEKLSDLEGGTFGLRIKDPDGNDLGLPKKIFTAPELDDVIGKEMADKIRKGEGRDHNAKPGTKILEGLDLKVGGEGMKGFYDKILPDFANKLGKKYGAKVGETGIAVGEVDSHEAVRTTSGDWVVRNERTNETVEGPFDDKDEAEERADFLDSNPHAKAALQKVHALDVTPALKDAALGEGFPLFQEGGEGPRGRIRIGGADFKIDLFKNADKSTFLHETGHAFLEILQREAGKEGAPEDLKRDYDTTLEYLGAKAGDALTSEQHEKWARSFEAYLMEGKAPSSALKAAFQRFKAWLMGVYQAATQLKVDINDDIRGVMDRMLSARDEVEAARSTVGMDLPLEGVPKEVAARVGELTRQAREHAEEALLKEQLKEISESQKAGREAERERLTREVSEELKTHPEADPVYAAIDHLRRTTKREPLGVANRFLENKVTDKEAARMEETAETHGFSSGEDLARYIVANEARGGFDADVKAMVDEKMPKLLEGEELKKEALRVIHDTKMTELLALEREALLGLTDRAVQSAAATKQRREQALAAAKQVNEEAKRILDAKGMSEATKAQAYFTAERNAAVKVQKAIAKKDYEAAARAKEQQMLSHALAREALRNRDEAESLVKFLEKAGSRAENLKRFPYGFSRQLIDLLSRRGLTDTKHEDTAILTQVAQHMAQEGESPADIANATGLRQNTQQVWVPETLTDFVARVNENYMALTLPDSVLNPDGRQWRKLTLPELRDLKETVKSISQIARTYKDFLSFESKFDIDQAGALFAESVEKEFGHPAADSLRIGSRNKGVIDNALGALKAIPGYFARQLDTMQTTVEKLDGMKDGLAKKYIYRPIAEAENKRLARLRDEMVEVDKLFGKHFTPEELSKYKDEHFQWNAEGDRVSKYELLAMLLNWGNLEGRDRIGRAEGKLSQEVEKQFFDHLSKKDFDFAQEVWNYLEKFKPEIKELEMRTQGHEPVWVESVPIVTPWGKTYEGGYYPLRYDNDRSATAFRYAEAATAMGQAYGGGKAQTEQGFTKERVATLRRPLRYDLSVLTDHLEDVVKDITYRDAVIDVSRFLGQKDVKGALLNALGVRGYGAMGDWLKAVAADPSMPTSYLGRAANWFRFKTTFYLMGYRIASAPKIGIENLVNISSELGVARAARAMGEYWFSFGGDVHNLVVSKSEFMRQRAEHLDRDMGDVLDKYKDEEGSAYHRFAFHTHAMLDQAVSFPLWSFVYKKSLGEGHADADAVHRADEAVRRSFMAGGTMNQAAVMRGGEYQKAMTVAFGYQSMMWNRYSRGMTEAAQKAAAGSYMDAAYVMARTHFYSFVMPAAVMILTTELLHNAAGGRHDKKDMEKRALEVGLHEGTPLKFLPIIRDIVPYALGKMLGEHGRDLQVTPLERAVQTLIDPELEMVARKMKGEKALNKRSAEQIVNQISLLVPVPKQIDDIVFNLLDWQRDHGKLTWQDFLKRRSKK